jgi:hypothetical protein
MQGAQNNQTFFFFENEEQSWKTHASQFQNLLQSYSNQDSGVFS